MVPCTTHFIKSGNLKISISIHRLRTSQSKLLGPGAEVCRVQEKGVSRQAELLAGLWMTLSSAEVFRMLARPSRNPVDILPEKADKQLLCLCTTQI